MTPNARKLRPPVKWHGGKSYLAQRIIRCFPDHRVYVEPFLGGGSVLLNKPPVETEVASDLDVDLINLWSILGSAKFYGIIRNTPYEERIFDLAGVAKDLEGNSLIDRAVFTIVRNRFSRGGLGKTFAWSERTRNGKPGDANAWDTIRADLPAIASRAMPVEFVCRPASDAIQKFDGPDTVHFCDPPYLHETRSSCSAYSHEMTRDDHVALLGLLSRVKGTVFLSGYRSAMYDAHASLRDWHRIEWPMPNHAGQGKTKQPRIEVLWSNRPFPGSVPCREAARRIGA